MRGRDLVYFERLKSAKVFNFQKLSFELLNFKEIIYFIFKS